jgi:hypothetical protein
MAFKLGKTSALSLDSPETLFRDIKTKKVPGPLADQADLWRAYQETAIGTPDVALQLPTGGGKTLVGLVLAEWRRQKFGERVVFLCPTRQLVNQVVAQATSQYGIKVHGFTGSNRDYDREAVAEYQNCERVAVTTYSSLFNAVPFFTDPHSIILDDAHASEQYVAGMWSLSVHRGDEEQRPLYEALLGVLKPALTAADFLRLAHPEETFGDRMWVEKLPTPTFQLLVSDLVKVIDANATTNDHRYTWRSIRDHLQACHVYFGAGVILIRPLIPPTGTHRPFAQARQRIYMSATFGGAGELERITGRPKIERLQAKASWDRQTIGRRYFLFPERSLSEEDQLTLCAKMMQRAGRTLVLTPDDGRAKKFREFVNKSTGFPLFNAQAIEKSKTDFVSRDKAVAVVANRYDGIDFPKDECRLLIVEGLPRATNLQEQFFITRMGAVDLLNVRITTRLVQAFGRCTRSDEDYSAVIVRGEELNKHLMTPERREFLHPELHAELDFGIEQAKGATIDGYLENFDIFLAQGDDWRAANGEIISKRDGFKQATLPGAANLEAAAPLEIEYQQSLWHGHYTQAFETARSILGILNDPKLRGYRALWHYLAGSAAWLAYKDGNAGFDGRAREQYSAALKAERTIGWLVPLSRLAGGVEEDPQVLADKDTWSIIERIEALFDQLGTLTDYKYDKSEAEIRKKLEQNDAAAFEEGHAKLGLLLGYDAGNKNVTASPDPWWLANGSLCLIFEDHSDGKPETILSVDKARQACTHPNWVRENLPVDSTARIIPILVTPVSAADDAALPHLKDVLVWALHDFREWARNALAVMRAIRKDYPGGGDLVWRAAAAEQLTKAAITPSALLEALKDRVGSEVLKKK